MRPPVGVSILAVILFLTALSASAQSRRVIDYYYDEAGNLIRIESSESLNPPAIQSITPDRIRVGPPVTVTATGTDLRLAEVTADDPSISVTNVASTPTTVTFDLQASFDTPLGPTGLNFTTRLGSTTGEVTIDPRLPEIIASPLPVVVGVAQTLALGLELSTTDIFDHVLSFSVADTGIAEVAPTSVTILAGDTKASEQVRITGIASGTTSLTISSPALADVTLSLFVTNPVDLPLGENTAFARNLGVVKESAPDPPQLLTQGPIVSEVSVLKGDDPDAPGGFVAAIQAPLVGALLGNAVTGVEPGTVVRGAGPTVLSVTGTGLESVTGVEVVPADDVFVNVFSASADGLSATLTLTAASAADIGQRMLVFNTAGTPLPGAAGSDRIQIASGIPRVDSVSPSVVTLASSANLVIRGAHFQNTFGVQISPLNGIILGGPPVVNETGTEVRIGITVPETAQLGDRVVTVTTGAGESDDAPSEFNSLTIVNGPVVIFENTFSPLVGVVKGEPPPAPLQVDPLISSVVGVTVGSVFTELVPASGIIGTTIELEVRGFGLENVSDIQFIPDDGLIVGFPAPSPDGTSVSVDVSIAPDAPETLREVRLFDAGVAVPASSGAANRFRVTAPQPLLRSISPNFVVIGDPAVELKLFGENFEDALSVDVLPPDDLSISPPIVSADGRTLSVNISASASAASGDRVVIVRTPAGETRAVATPANTLTVTSEILRAVSPLVAPQVGVFKSAITTPVESALLVAAPLVGVNVEETPEPPSDQVLDLEASQLGIAVGPTAQAVTPASIPVETGTVLIIQGSELSDVTNVEFMPSDGISITGPVVAVPNGTEVQVPIAVDATAPLTVREVVLTSIDGRIPFSSREGGRIKIAAGTPEILSIEPIQQVPGARFTLTIRGSNLGDAFRVFAEPSAGVNFGSTITSNADGTEITLDMSVDQDASIGLRVIRVDTPAGTTTSTPSSANTFSVVTQ